MKNNHLAIKVKELRSRKGMSQEILAEESGLSLRTIQRIENRETDPTGDTLKRLSSTLNVSPDELIDWTINEDTGYLTYLNLSALTFIFFPLLGILVPFIMWTAKKNKLKDIDRLGKELINFEITWTIILFFIPFLLFALAKIGIINSVAFSTIIPAFLIMYLYNIIFVIFNALQIHNKKDIVYSPKISFLR